MSGVGNKMKVTAKAVKPMLSINAQEARNRVLGLYKAFYRFSPYIIRYFDIPKTDHDVRCMIREYFLKNKDVQDIRVIDVLVIKGWMELKELKHNWQQKSHVMAHWKPSHEPKPCDFLGQFLANMDE